MKYNRTKTILPLLGLTLACHTIHVVNSRERMSPSLSMGHTWTFLMVESSPHYLECRNGIAKVTMERGGIFGFATGIYFEYFGIAPTSVLTYRQNEVHCVVDGTSGSSGSDSSNFSDIVSLKNGEILTGVKVAVTGDSVVVTTKNGEVTVYSKKDIAGIKKKE